MQSFVDEGLFVVLKGQQDLDRIKYGIIEAFEMLPNDSLLLITTRPRIVVSSMVRK